MRPGIIVDVTAAHNRLVLTPALTRSQGQRASRWVVRSIGAEAVLVIVILGLVAGWRFMPPDPFRKTHFRAEKSGPH